MVLLLVPFVEMIAAARQGTVASGAIQLAVASYFVIAVTRTLLGLFGAEVSFVTLQILAEGGVVSLLLAYMAVYRFTMPPADRALHNAPA
jgi:hypothetical protein